MASEPTTAEGRVNRNAFTLAHFVGKAEELPKGADEALRARIKQLLAPIRLAPAAWFRASLGTETSPSDRRKIIESIADTEIWKCVGGSCAGCPGNEVTGCVLSNLVAGGGIGVVAMIHPCLYGDGACPRGGSNDANAWVENFVLGVAYYKSGLPKNGTAYRKALQASHDWIATTSKTVNATFAGCPGPFPGESLKFLFGLGAVSLPNPALLRCGQNYLEALRALPSKCKALAGPLKEEWAGYEKVALRPNADILRCDVFCLKMLCRTRDAGSIFTRFAGKPALLLGDGACEGESPKLAGRFTRDSIPRGIRKKLEEGSCLPAVEKLPSGTVPETATGGIGNGPEVDLIE
jgi:hypothetical protein